MIGRTASSAARRVSAMLAPRRVSAMLAPAPKSRLSDCSIQRKALSYRDPSLWTIHAPIPRGEYVKRTEYEGSRLQASSSHKTKTKTNLFVPRLVGKVYSVDCRFVLTPLSFGDDGRLCAPKYSIRFPFPFDHHRHSGCKARVDCNGVFCYSVGDYLVVWNPTTMEIRKLPNSPNTERATGNRRMQSTYIACWADEDNYKVMRFYKYVNVKYFDGDDYPSPYDPVEMELYSLKTDSWKNITCCENLTTSIYPCCTDGAVYWSHRLEFEPGSGRSHAVIMSFDFRSETFSTLPFPPLDENENEMTFYRPVRCNGQLSVVACIKSPCIQELWVTRNGEWVRLCGYHFSQDLVLPLKFARNGEVVLFERKFWEPELHYVLMAFDSITGELKQIPGFASRTPLEVFELSQTFVKLKSSSSSAVAGKDVLG